MIQELIFRAFLLEGFVSWVTFYEKTKRELDFYVRSLIDYKNYEIKVKSTDTSAKQQENYCRIRRYVFVYSEENRCIS